MMFCFHFLFNLYNLYGGSSFLCISDAGQHSDVTYKAYASQCHRLRFHPNLGCCQCHQLFTGTEPGFIRWQGFIQSSYNMPISWRHQATGTLEGIWCLKINWKKHVQYVHGRYQRYSQRVFTVYAYLGEMIQCWDWFRWCLCCSLYDCLPHW